MKNKIAVVVSAPMTLKAFLRDQIRAMAEIYDVVVIANFADDEEAMKLLPATVRCISIAIERQIAPHRDLAALLQLYRLFRKEGFALVHSVSPKAGLLAALAGWLAWVPHRLHTFTGQVWATKQGMARHGLRLLDKFTASILTTVLADSRSQAEFLVANRVVSTDRIQVLADGSISGVDVERFRRKPEIRSRVRQTLGFGAEELLFVYLGRLKREKGVLDLAHAFSKVAKQISSVGLVFIGPDEEGLTDTLAALTGPNPKVRFVPYTPTPEHYLMAADIFCLPSYREGFGSTVIEAAVAGAPAIGTRIYGLTDAIEDGDTGLLVTPGNIQELTDAMMRLAKDTSLRDRLAQKAYRRACEKFSQQRVTNAVMKLYETLLVAQTNR